MTWLGLVGIVVAVAIVGGCGGESAELLRRCEQAEAEGDIGNAWRHCSTAADQGSSAAKEKLQQLKPKYDALQAEMKAKKDAEAAERRKAAEAEQAARIEALRRKVSPKWWGDEPDGECQAKGLPAFRKTYEGGLYAENEAVAFADGCRHLFQQRSEPSVNSNIFCCPGR